MFVRYVEVRLRRSKKGMDVGVVCVCGDGEGGGEWFLGETISTSKLQGEPR